MTADPGREAGEHADALEDHAAAMLASVEALDDVRPASLDPRAVFLAMSRALESVRKTAVELADQEWVTPDEDEASRERWQLAMKSLDTASGFFDEVANGWI